MARVAVRLMVMITPAVERILYLLVVLEGSLVTETDQYLSTAVAVRLRVEM